MTKSKMAMWLLPVAALLMLSANAPLAPSGTATTTPKLKMQTFDSRMEPADVDTVCCQINNWVWWSAAHQCTRAGGATTTDATCATRHIGDDPGQRVCCHKDQNQWWSTFDKCTKIGGRSTSSETCGADWNNHVPAQRLR